MEDTFEAPPEEMPEEPPHIEAPESTYEEPAPVESPEPWAPDQPGMGGDDPVTPYDEGAEYAPPPAGGGTETEPTAPPPPPEGLDTQTNDPRNNPAGYPINEDGPGTAGLVDDPVTPWDERGENSPPPPAGPGLATEPQAPPPPPEGTTQPNDPRNNPAGYPIDENGMPVREDGPPAGPPDAPHVANEGTVDDPVTPFDERGEDGPPPPGDGPTGEQGDPPPLPEGARPGEPGEVTGRGQPGTDDGSEGTEPPVDGGTDEDTGGIGEDMAGTTDEDMPPYFNYADGTLEPGFIPADAAGSVLAALYPDAPDLGDELAAITREDGTVDNADFITLLESHGANATTGEEAGVSSLVDLTERAESVRLLGNLQDEAVVLTVNVEDGGRTCVCTDHAGNQYEARTEDLNRAWRNAGTPILAKPPGLDGLPPVGDVPAGPGAPAAALDTPDSGLSNAAKAGIAGAVLVPMALGGGLLARRIAKR